jgi:imidazolonepropionase-like amidohydrolase
MHLSQAHGKPTSRLLYPGADERVIDADGLIVAPGFIDGHTRIRRADRIRAGRLPLRRRPDGAILASQRAGI